MAGIVPPHGEDPLLFLLVLTIDLNKCCSLLHTLPFTFAHGVIKSGLQSKLGHNTFDSSPLQSDCRSPLPPARMPDTGFKRYAHSSKSRAVGGAYGDK
jgi:hypothetical protein